ncbi:MAG: hypothetical protein Kow002_00950 [Anaerolineales bacterium]
MKTALLTQLPLGEIRSFDSIGSTNDYAMQWADQGAGDLSLVLANEQTAGRGRTGHKWFTPQNTALAFSLILRPTGEERAHPARTTGLLAVALTESLLQHGLNPLIKWPNDILLNASKVAGILVESIWAGDQLEALILGMGVNVHKGAVPPANELRFPATSVEDALGASISREILLKDILTALLAWRPKLGTAAFMAVWEKNLAYIGQQVRVWKGSEVAVMGKLLGLNPDGSLHLQDEHGKSVTVHFGEVHLRSLA